MFKVEIPKPCHADWTEMTPTQKGAFCASCSKEVVDFTRMSDEEVQNYFLIHSNSKTCGHFRTAQLHRIRIELPENIFIQKTAGWKKFMAVLLLTFGSMLFGCDVGMKDQTTETVTVSKTTKNIKNDSLQPGLQGMLGMIAFTNDSTLFKTPECHQPISPVRNEPTELMGVTMIIPYTIQKELPDTTATFATDTSTFTKGEMAIVLDTSNKKPVSDTGKCHDTGYY